MLQFVAEQFHLTKPFVPHHSHLIFVFQIVFFVLAQFLLILFWQIAVMRFVIDDHNALAFHTLF